jgi:hypothetical protein
MIVILIMKISFEICGFKTLIEQYTIYIELSLFENS